jgi:hypothetical protein
MPRRKYPLDVQSYPCGEILPQNYADSLFTFRGRPQQAIWDIQIGKHGRDSKDFDVVQLARATEGLTGSEIENVFIEALYLAFDSGGEAGEKEPTDLDIARVLTEFVPLSKLMAEQIGGF